MSKKFLYYLQKARRFSFSVVAEKASFKIKEGIVDRFKRYRDFRCPTWSNLSGVEIAFSYIDPKKLELSSLDLGLARYLTEKYLSHRFDLLGSGWIRNSYEDSSLGTEAYKYDMNFPFDLTLILHEAHQAYAQKLFSMIDKDYLPIDWQKDFKSGYRFSQKVWYKDYSVFHLPGVDAKVPWELARFQHLVRLAIFSIVLEDMQPLLIKEFRNQVLDFIATNPPRMGINWTCTMEVGIRVSNLLVAYDIFSQLDRWQILDSEFKSIFARSVYDHGYHIANNLEWSEQLRSNHYLANIAGLVFAGAYLKGGGECDCWLAFGLQELIREFLGQFYRDGGNFEASSGYHRLSGELILLTSALVLGLPAEKLDAIEDVISKNVGRGISTHCIRSYPSFLPIKEQGYKISPQGIVFPQWFIDRLYKAGRFTRDILKPNNKMVQIGDNDSGRFFILSPVGRFLTNKEAEDIYMNLKGYNKMVSDYGDEPDSLFWDEDNLDVRPTISYFGGLLEDDIFANEFILERTFVESLCKGRKLKAEYKDCLPENISSDSDPDIEANAKLDIISHARSEDLACFPYRKKAVYRAGACRYDGYKIDACKDDIKTDETKVGNLPPFTFNLKVIPYPDFGLYIFRSDRLWLSIFAGPVGQNGNGGHSHNDKLSVELNIDGEDLLVDPGTYLYTPSPELRNLFRSTSAHNTLLVDSIEQNDWYVDGYWGLFSIRPETKTEILRLTKNYIAIKLTYKDVIQIREVLIEEDSVIIQDSSNLPFIFNVSKVFSNGYGKRLR